MNAPLITWDLSRADVSFPVTIGGRIQMYVFMKPYRPYDLKLLFDQIRVRMQTKEQNAVDLLSPDSDLFKDFFEKHFLFIEGLNVKDGESNRVATREEALAWIRKNPRFGIEKSIIQKGYGGLLIESDEPDTNGMLIDDEVGRNIETFQALWFPEQKAILRVKLVHTFGKESSADLHQFEKSGASSRLNTKKQELQTLINYDVIEQLYNRLIVGVSGYSLGDEPCTGENREEWLPLIPFWHKDMTIREFFNGVSLKNE